MVSSGLLLPVLHGIQDAFVANCRYFRCVLACGDSPQLPLTSGDHEFGGADAMTFCWENLAALHRALCRCRVLQTATTSALRAVPLGLTMRKEFPEIASFL